MTATARAFWVVAPGRGEIRDQPLAQPGPGEVLVRTLYSAVSRGTEALVFQGRVPESEWQRMRCPHQEGQFPAPVKYGYANVGEVMQGPEALRGGRVLCLYPHQTSYVVPVQALSPIPEGVPAERAVLGPNLETALNAVWDARPMPGDRVSVVGGGVVGCLVAYLVARLPGSDVELVDVNGERAPVARALGAGFADPASARGERDLVFHASGTPDGLARALELCAPEAQLLELSWFGDARVSLPLGQAFHSRRLSLRSSQVGRVSPHARPRYGYRERLALALELCKDPVLDVLFGTDSPFEALPELMPRLSDAHSGVLCQRLAYT